MRISLETPYPGDPDTVVAVRLDRDFLAEVCRRTGALSHSVDASRNDDGSGRSVVRRTVPTTDFPDVARRFVGPTIDIVEEIEWAAAGGVPRTAQARMHPEGMPVSLTASVELRPAPSGSVEMIVGEVTARVPLVGGRIEKAIVPALREGLDVQAAAMRDWLSR